MGLLTFVISINAVLIIWGLLTISRSLDNIGDTLDEIRDKL